MIRICHTPCFTLNVTSTHLRNGHIIPFGVAHGCSTNVLALSRLQRHNCLTIDVVLKTLPPYIVQAEYCFCTGDQCNELKDVPETLTKQKSRSAIQEVIVPQESGASQLFYALCVHMYILFLNMLDL
ncbi:unnamed protein product [Toxocara canis]|uniref:Uncharacterized protein n=1 Tax=Toxocara canis TaxID=6265 RepID=A0A3P7HCB5_TOXCA|nr:unnamed protein product [Toxocara canis]